MHKCNTIEETEDYRLVETITRHGFVQVTSYLIIDNFTGDLLSALQEKKAAKNLFRAEFGPLISQC